jgi:hypothetical protein
MDPWQQHRKECEDFEAFVERVLAYFISDYKKVWPSDHSLRPSVREFMGALDYWYTEEQPEGVIF